MIYEWKCRACGSITDVNRTVDARHLPPNRVCLDCGAEDWARVYSSSTPFQGLANRGVFMDQHGNYPPRKIE